MNIKIIMNYINLKYLACLAILFTFCVPESNAQQLSFSYDAAGNQVVRQWICVNCPSGQTAAVPSDKLTALDKSLLGPQTDVTSSATRSLKAFPNPVTETLKVEWSASHGIFIK